MKLWHKFWPKILASIVIAVVLGFGLGVFSGIQANQNLSNTKLPTKTITTQIIKTRPPTNAKLKILDEVPQTVNISEIATQTKDEQTPPDCSKIACLALTFDDGPDPINMPLILESLTRQQVHGTFFVIGNKVAANQQLIKTTVGLGNELGDHSWDHHDFRKMSVDQIAQEINKTQDAVKSLGLPMPTIFRPPYEFTNGAVEKYIALPIILWNIDPKDWQENNPAALEQVVVSVAKPGSIVVMHATKPGTAEAIDQIIQDLKPRYKLVTVSQLLNPKPNFVYFSQYDIHGVK